MLVSPADKMAMGPKDVYDASQVAIIGARCEVSQIRRIGEYSSRYLHAKLSHQVNKLSPTFTMFFEHFNSKKKES